MNAIWLSATLYVGSLGGTTILRTSHRDRCRVAPWRRRETSKFPLPTSVNERTPAASDLGLCPKATPLTGGRWAFADHPRSASLTERSLAASRTTKSAALTTPRNTADQWVPCRSYQCCRLDGAVFVLRMSPTFLRRFHLIGPCTLNVCACAAGE